MRNTTFINEAFCKSLNLYLDYKNDPDNIKFNSFLVVVLRMLIFIFDELDLINPYNFENEFSLYNNLKKYGSTQEELENLFDMMQSFYTSENCQDFINIQKLLINMYGLKKRELELTSEVDNEFRKMLFSPYADNPMIVSYNFMISKSPMEIIEYFDAEIKKYVKQEVARPKEKLNLEAYEILKYSLEDIDSMNADEIDDINKKVYNYFDINENAINKKYLLDKAVYEHNHPKPEFSTGNGYVDIIFILAIIMTLIMLIILITAII